MFEARMANAGVFRKIIDSIRDLIQECSLECSQTGMTMQSMDSSHVCLVSICIKSDGFEFFRCDRPVTMGVNMQNLAKVLKCASNNDVLLLQCDDDATELKLTFENSDEERVANFSLKLMTIDEEHLGIPDAKYDALIELPSGEFQRICRDLKEFGDSIKIECAKETVVFSTRGDIGEGRIQLKERMAADSNDKVSIKLTGNATMLTFALKYLNNFTKATSLASTVNINLAQNTPLCVNYNIQDEIGWVRFYLAPKIEDAEE